MRKYRRWLVLGLPLLLGAALVAALVEPTQTVRAWLAGEPFYKGRPVRYWREVLREGGASGTIPREVFYGFGGPRDPDTFAVLSVCARDPDRNVRWPAIAILGQRDYPTQPSQGVLIEALADEDMEVRLQAIGGLARWGRMSRPAFAALTARLNDPELQVAHCADLALWDIDEPAAVAACGWRSFRKARLGFSVMLPEEPKPEDLSLFGGCVVSHAFMAWHRAGPYQSPTRYVVQVVEYPEDIRAGATQKEREEALRTQLPAFFPDGKVIEEKEVTQGSLHGKDYLLETAGLGRLRARHFWVGRKLYALMIAHQVKFLNKRAAAYFLDSFRLEKEKPTGPGPKR